MRRALESKSRIIPNKIGATFIMSSTQSLSIGIAGAGLLGRLLAWQLSRAGHRVSVFDVARGPGPVFRSQADDSDVPTAAGFTAAGMLSPLAELDTVEPAVAALGWRSIALWRDIAAALPQRPMFRSEGSLMLAHREDLGAAQRVLERLRTACETQAWQNLSPPEGVQPLELARLHELEPALQGPAHAWLLPGEGQLDAVAMMMALHDDSPGAQWHWSRPVRCVEENGTLHFADGGQAAFDAVIDTRGVGAQASRQGACASASPVFDVRGVRGEVIWLQAPAHGLTRLTRLLHPRHGVYIVPRSPDLLLIGASELETEDRSPASLRSTVELLAAAHSAMPALAEARILRLDVNLRPALPDNNPCTEWRGRCLRINGLFRHGWLLAPALTEQAMQLTGWLK